MKTLALRKGSRVLQEDREELAPSSPQVSGVIHSSSRHFWSQLSVSLSLGKPVPNNRSFTDLLTIQFALPPPLLKNRSFPCRFITIFIRASTFVNTAVGHSGPNTGNDYQGIFYYPKAVPAVTGFDFSRVSEALTTPFFSFTIQDGQPIRMLIHLYSLASSLLSRLLSSVVGRHDQLRLVWNASCSCELQVWNTSWSAPVLVSSQLLVDSSSLDQYSAPFDSPFRIWSPHPV